MLKDRIAQSVFWLVWSRGFIQAASFASTILVARVIDPSAFGLMALAGVWISILMLVCDLGLTMAVVQFRDLRNEELNLCFFLANVTAILIYSALYMAAPIIAAWFNSAELADVLRVSSLVLPITAVRGVHDALLRKQLQFKSLSKVDMCGALAAIPTVLLLAYGGWGVWALVSGALAGSLSRTLATFWYARWRPSFTISTGRFFQISRFSLASIGSTVVWATYDQSDAFVLGKVSGEGTLGFYSMAKDLAHLPVVKISALINELATPVMAELQAQPSEMAKALLRGLRLSACFSMPLCLGLVLVAEDAVMALLTSKWLPAVPALQVLSFVALIKSMDVLLPPVLRARRRAEFLLVYNLVLLAIMPVGFLIGAWWLGPQGVAVAWAVLYPIVMLWMAREALRELGLLWQTVAAQIRVPAAAASVMSATVLAIQHVLDGPGELMTWLRLGAAVAVGACVYVGVVLSWRGRESRELRELILWIFRPRKSAALTSEQPTMVDARASRSFNS